MKGFELDDMFKKFKLVRRNNGALICAIVGAVLLIAVAAVLICKFVNKGCPFCGEKCCDGECDDDDCCCGDSCCCDDDDDDEIEAELSFNDDDAKNE